MSRIRNMTYNNLMAVIRKIQAKGYDLQKARAWQGTSSVSSRHARWESAWRNGLRGSLQKKNGNRNAGAEVIASGFLYSRKENNIICLTKWSAAQATTQAGTQATTQAGTQATTEAGTEVKLDAERLQMLFAN